MPPSSKIIAISKTIIIKVHPIFLNIYHVIINDNSVLNEAIRFLFFKDCWMLYKLLWSLSADRIYFQLAVAGAAYDI